MRLYQHELEWIDRALSFVGGNRPAAAKLRDLTLEELNHAINNNEMLREKWGKKKRGRPKGTLPFPIHEFCPEQARRALRKAGLAREICKMTGEYVDVERVHELLSEERKRAFRRLRGGRVVPPPEEARTLYRRLMGGRKVPPPVEVEEPPSSAELAPNGDGHAADSQLGPNTSQALAEIPQTPSSQTPPC